MEPTAAADYDRMVEYASYPPDTEATVDGLARLCPPGGRLLELGVGTGRLAIPLAQRGFDVHGVELDRSMAEQMLLKDGSDGVRLHVADMKQPVGAGEFDLIVVAFGTLFALPTQEDQVCCFRSAAEQLTPGGRFVVEALVPQPGTYTEGRKVTVAKADDEEVILTVGLLNPVEQVVKSEQVVLSNGDVRLFGNRIRYAWPAELDLMARLAGLSLSARWSDWQGTPFDAHSPRHVSVYTR